MPSGTPRAQGCLRSKAACFPLRTSDGKQPKHTTENVSRKGQTGFQGGLEDRSARARSFRLKSEWTESAPGPRGPSRFLFFPTHPHFCPEMAKRPRCRVAAQAHERSEPRTLFQVSPDGPCSCCLISSVLPPSRCYLRSIFLLRQYVGTLIDLLRSPRCP